MLLLLLFKSIHCIVCHGEWEITLQPGFLLFYGIQLLGEVEEHLNCTITQVEPDIKVPVDDFDGKVAYGKRKAAGGKWTSLHFEIEN